MDTPKLEKAAVVSAERYNEFMAGIMRLNAQQTSSVCPEAATARPDAIEPRIVGLLRTGRGHRERLWAVGRVLDTEPEDAGLLHGSIGRAESFALALAILRFGFRSRAARATRLHRA